MTYAPNHMAKQQYQAYANARMMVGKVRQVVMLYDGAMDAIQQAVEAIRKEDYETRFNMLSKASAIIDGLQNSLDFTQGGDVAKLLHDYYSSIDARLFSVHRSNDAELCLQVIKEIKMMRDAWDRIDQDNGQQEAAAMNTTTPRQGAAPAALGGAGVSA